MTRFTSFSLSDTLKIAEKLAKKIIKNQSFLLTKNALVLGLIGELGSGKTAFISGFLRGLKLKPSPSPTFILMRRKKIKNKKFKNVYHIDLYRIKNKSELKPLKIKEILKDPKNIVLIEWANKIKNILPPNALKIYLKHGKKENERLIVFKNIFL